MAAMHVLSDPLELRRGPRWPHRIALAPLTNWQSHADGTLSDAEMHWLTMRCSFSIRAGAPTPHSAASRPSHLGTTPRPAHAR